MGAAVKMFQPVDMRPTVEITAFTLTSLSTLIVAIRAYCRFWTVGRLMVYDYMMCAALLCTWGLCVCNHYQLMFGSGSPDSLKIVLPGNKPPDEKLINYLLRGSAVSWYAYHIGYLVDLALIKLSILTFYLSFATNRTFRILVHLCIGVVALGSISMILVVALQCPSKPHYAITPALFKYRGSVSCLDLHTVLYAQAALNLASYPVIILLPLPILLRLRMHTAKRLSLILVFSISLLVPVASGIRFWGLYLWATSGRQARYYGGYIIFWSQVELNTAIICASAPCLRVLFKYIIGNFSGLHRSRSPFYYYGGARNTMTLQSIIEVNDQQSTTFQSTTPLKRPEPAYQSRELPDEENQKMQGVVVRDQQPTQEEVVRDRVRAFANRSSPSSPVFPQRSFPAHGKTFLATG